MPILGIGEVVSPGDLAMCRAHGMDAELVGVLVVLEVSSQRSIEALHRAG